ncbi:hypothetical protein Csa_003917 [Cucumis sativus]|uniref:Uncharacterized protein n=1 Tax=Cucumis sativus TaxID=3659 RepID=A0A0A0KHJ7_CUCSA|nr:hypothetical protein Csa_003917 [Cucumis sativus]
MGKILWNVDVSFVPLSVFCTHVTHVHCYFPYIRSKLKTPPNQFLLIKSLHSSGICSPSSLHNTIRRIRRKKKIAAD